MQITFSKQANTGIVKIDNDLNIVKVDTFRQKFTEWFSPNLTLKNIVVDMSQVQMMDSAGLGLLISFLKQAGQRGGSLHLINVQKRVRLVFNITRTHRIFGFYESLDEAIAAFES